MKKLTQIIYGSGEILYTDPYGLTDSGVQKPYIKRPGDHSSYRTPDFYPKFSHILIKVIYLS